MSFFLNKETNGLQVESPHTYREHFYRLLEPWVHYIPVAVDLSDLDAARQWALAHADDVQRIGANARRLFETRLRAQDLFCYVARLLMSVSAAQVKDGSRVSGDALQAHLGAALFAGFTEARF